MLKYGNRDFRNLQEQVYANMKNIEDIIKGSDITMDYKLNIVAQVAKVTDLPDANTYGGNYGDIYIVGETAPLDAYVFGKVYKNENAPSWIELGEIFVQGPQGLKGEQGNAAGFAEPTVSASTLASGSPATVSIVASGPDTAKEFAFTFGIPKGDKGDTGAQGPQGPKGEKGSGTSVSDFVEGTGIAISSAANDKVEIAVDKNKVLVTPESAPAAQQLVGINTSGKQNALGIGAGLEVSNGALINGVKVLTINATFAKVSARTVDVELTDEIVTNMRNGVYSLVLLKASDISMNDFVIVNNTSNSGSNFNYTGNSILGSTTSLSYKLPGLTMSKQFITYNITKKYNTTNIVTVTRYESTIVDTEDTWNIYIKLAGGTLSNTDYASLNNANFQTPLLLNGVTGTTYVKLYNCYYSSSAIVYRNIPCGNVSTQYEVVINPSTKEYVVNTIS